MGISTKIEPRQIVLSMLATLYHEECELFDRSVCPGSGIPRTGRELARMADHAREVREKIKIKAELLGINSMELQRAIHREGGKYREETDRVCLCETLREPEDGDYAGIAVEPLVICDAWKPDI